ncbi:hypothetical protein BJY00DRAFT_98693 [Aspergillus carlsbadensis]|nr:hypothetical protein BJY00DRAFT_98693 [Aspergillus carlsbadensis]
MKYTGLFAIASLFSLQGLVLSSPVESDPLAGYEITTPDWEIPAFPNGEPLKFTGTIEEVHAELIALNPNWDEDFLSDVEDIPYPDESDFELETRSLDTEGVTTLAKRTDFSSSRFFCFGRWGSASHRRIGEGIRYLRGVGGRPSLAAGPSRCSRVSCSYNSAIHWCNDDNKRKTLNSFGSIADGAQVILDRCVAYNNGAQITGGQIFHSTHWNVIVTHARC